MSFAPQSISNPEAASGHGVSENRWNEEAIEPEEVDLESPAGRAILIQEIENLALTCDVADDPDMFANSDVFELVADLQACLSDIEQTQSIGQSVTDEQVETVQRLYDELAVAVEQSAVISVYVGPSRRDMLLEDLSDEGRVSITKPPVPEVVPVDEVRTETPVVQQAIHNSLPTPPKPAATYTPQTLTSTKRASLYQPDAPEVAVQKMIHKIESAELSFLDSWINDYQSPYEVLGSMQFADLQTMAAAPVHSRTYVEFKSLLAQERVKYEVFNQWVQLFADMEELVDRAQYKTLQQVIEEYLLIQVERNSQK